MIKFLAWLLLTASLCAQTGTYQNYGNGCSTNTQISILQHTLNNPPNIGQPFTIRYTNVPFFSRVGITGYAIIFFGVFPRTLRLPFTGCTIYTSSDILLHSVIQMNGIPQAITPFTMPNDPIIIGYTFFTQTFLYSAAPPPFDGFTLTNGLGFTIGR